MAEAGNVNLAFMNIWRNDRFSRSGSELCLSLSETERQQDHRSGNDLGNSSQVNRTALSFHPAPKQKSIRKPDAHAKGRSSLEEPNPSAERAIVTGRGLATKSPTKVKRRDKIENTNQTISEG
jgi:hypothetical protein